MKTTIILFLSFMLATNLKAQQTSFGIKGGVNFANVTSGNESEADKEGLIGLHAGLLAHIHINEHWAVQPELFYSGQGVRFNNGNAPDTRWRLNYINLPVLAQYMWGSGFRVETGPQLGFLAGAESKTGDITVNSKDAFKNIDFSWAFGASYLTPSRLGFSARYNAGITDITDNNSTFRNSVFSLGLFYHFPHHH